MQVALSAAIEAFLGLEPSAAIVGLSLTYSFQVTGYLNGFMVSFAAAEVRDFCFSA